MCLVQNRGRKACARGRNAVNYEATVIVGKDAVADTALCSLPIFVLAIGVFSD